MEFYLPTFGVKPPALLRLFLFLQGDDVVGYGICPVCCPVSNVFSITVNSLCPHRNMNRYSEVCMGPICHIFRLNINTGLGVT